MNQLSWIVLAGVVVLIWISELLRSANKNMCVLIKEIRNMRNEIPPKMAGLIAHKFQKGPGE